MAKEDYYRKLVIYNEDKLDNQKIGSIFGLLQDWTYVGTKIDTGIIYHRINNVSQNASVLFVQKYDHCLITTHVHYINANDKQNIEYRSGYDFSENQAQDIKDDILFELCKSLKEIDGLIAGIVPATMD